MIRVSSLPRLMRCAAALTVEGVDVDPHHEASNVGTAVHAALADLVIAGETKDHEEYHEQHGIEGEEMQTEFRILLAQGRKVWDTVRTRFPNPEVEREWDAVIDGEVIRGHIDVYSSSASPVRRFLDWKSGRKQKSHHEQMRGYAYGIHAATGETHIVGDVAWLRSGQIESYQFGPEDWEAFESAIRRDVLSKRHVFSPGEHCMGCPREMACPGRQQQIRGALAAMGSNSDDGFLALLDDPEAMRTRGPEVEAMRAVASRVQSLAESVLARIKAAVEVSGPLPLDDGRELRITTQRNREVVPSVVLPALVLELSPDELDECVTVRVKALEALARKAKGKNGHNTIKAAQEAVETALEADGGLRFKERHILGPVVARAKEIEDGKQVG